MTSFRWMLPPITGRIRAWLNSSPDPHYFPHSALHIEDNYGGSIVLTVEDAREFLEDLAKEFDLFLTDGYDY